MSAQLSPATISRIPRGLLDFLGLKSGGRNPSQIAEYIQPTFDLFAHYAACNGTTFQLGPVAGAGIGDGDFLAVAPPTPQTECKFITDYAVRCIVPAGTTWSVIPTLQVRASGGLRTAVMLGPIARHSGGAAEEIVIGRAERPFYMPPDSIFGFITVAYTGAGLCPVYMAVTQLQVQL